MRYLLEKGADVDVQTSSGYTALHQAAQQGHTVVITLLLQSKASPNIQNIVRQLCVKEFQYGVNLSLIWFI